MEFDRNANGAKVVDGPQLDRPPAKQTKRSNVSRFLVTLAAMLSATAAGCSGRLSNFSILAIVFAASLIGIFVLYGVYARNNGRWQFTNIKWTRTRTGQAAAITVVLIVIAFLYPHLWPFSAPHFFAGHDIQLANNGNTQATPPGTNASGSAAAINLEVKNRTEITKLQSDAADTNAAVGNLKDHVSKVEGKMSTAEGEIAGLKGRVSTLEARPVPPATTVVVAPVVKPRVSTRRIVKTEQYADPVTGQRYIAVFRR